MWQAGGKGSRPKPIPRPDDKSQTTYGTQPIDIDEARARFAARDKAS